MKNYNFIRQVRISCSEKEVNRLLDDCWYLLGIQNRRGKVIFILGSPFSESFEEIAE